jgi:D-alanyl-D-alanine dipeptidase
MGDSLHRRCSVARLLVMLALLTPSAVHAQERPARFVDVATVVPGLRVEMRYFGSNNFVGRPIDGYEKPLCLLTREAAGALAQVARDLEPRGLGLKVFDCYRPARAVAHFLRWARNVRDVARKAEFYPDLDKGTLFRDGYISTHSRHSSGSTLDLTLVRLPDGRELDMGTTYDFFSPRAWPSSRSVSSEAQANRAMLTEAMRRRGFRPYAKEWWHFTLQHEPFPDMAFDFPVR